MLRQRRIARDKAHLEKFKEIKPIHFLPTFPKID